ncbi:hypothetical protein KEM55_006066, partial [Ascosphaera atra]
KPRMEVEEEDEEFEYQTLTRFNKCKTPLNPHRAPANTSASQKKCKTTIAILSDSK